MLIKPTQDFVVPGFPEFIEGVVQDVPADIANQLIERGQAEQAEKAKPAKSEDSKSKKS